MKESRVFRLQTVSLQQIVQQVEHFLQTEKKMEVQSVPAKDGYLLQAAQADTLRTLSGMKLAITVQFSQMGEELNVTVGEGQWADKLGAGAVGLFFLWPLAITAGVGAYKQKMLPSEIFDVVQQAVSGFGAVPSSQAGAQAAQSIVCPQCHAQVPRASKFCSCCGAKLLENCPRCGAALQPGSKFCAACGQALV